MNKLLFYIFSLILIVSCASDNIEDGITTDNNLPATGQDNNKEEEILWPQDVMTATMKGVDAEGSNEMTRSYLYYYHQETPAGMAFRWIEGEKVGVFNEDNTWHPQVTLTSDIEDSEKSSTARFYVEDPNVDYFFNGHYYAYRPYDVRVGESISNTAIPVDYTGQTQTANVKMSLWTESDKTAYTASEKSASAHLGDKDYLVSSATSFAGGGIHFDMKRLGGIIRFYFIAPKDGEGNVEEVIYDEIQLVNKENLFTLKTTMSLPGQALAAEPIETSHMVSLSLEGEGFDFTSENTHRDEYKYNKIGYGHLIIAYMMMAPVNLTTKSTIYLLGRTSGGDRKYYKATAKEKNIEADFLYQWSQNDLTPDEPITFESITVEQWREGTTFNNNGEGTQTW